jgi:hypothetical protein
LARPQPTAGSGQAIGDPAQIQIRIAPRVQLRAATQRLIKRPSPAIKNGGNSDAEVQAVSANMTRSLPSLRECVRGGLMVGVLRCGS